MHNRFSDSASASPPQGLPPGRAALAIAHPGHEVAIHHWVELARPRAFILTNGSGHSAQGRLHLTTDKLGELGVEQGGWYGRCCDADVYRALLARDVPFFVALAEELAASLLNAEIAYVVGDALEGYNSGHDACRLLLNTAVTLAEQKSGRAIANFDFALGGPPGTCSAAQRDKALWLHLDDAAFARKMAAVRKNPYIEYELNFLLTHLELSIDAFRVECLRPVVRHSYADDFQHAPPFYEQHGARRVAEGYYQQVVRHRDHFLPIAAALAAHVAGKG